MKKRFVLLLCGLMILLSACSDGAPAVPSVSSPPAAQTAQPQQEALQTYTMLSLQGAVQAQPQQDQLTPVWREKTGVQMQCVCVSAYESYDQYLQTAIDQNTLPDVLALDDGIFNVPQRLEMLMQAHMLKPIDYETARAHMPLTATRLETMGIRFEDWFYANADADGLWYYVPQLPNALYDVSLRSTRFGVDHTPLELSYFWVRDDWLTAVNNYAADETSFQRLYEVFADNMTVEYVCDFWPGTLEDWTRFFADVKDYAYANFQVVTPVFPTYGDSTGAVVWSLYGAGGLCWDDLTAEFPNDLISGGDAFSYYAQTDQWETYIRWLNDCVLNQYTDLTYSTRPSIARPELYADQYAVLNQWIKPPSGMSPITGDPFGWRYYPVLTDSVINALQNNAVTYLTLLSDGAVGFNAQTVSDAQLETLLGWVDWNYSLEAAQLRQWGVGLSQGEGSARRFDYQYEAVAAAMLGDRTRAQAAWAYGLVNVLDPQRTYWNHEVYGVGGEATAQHPFYTYPLTDITYDQQYFVTYVVKQYLLDLVLDMQYVPVADDAAYGRALDELAAALDAFKQSFAQELSAASQQALRGAVMAPQGTFDTYYSQYLAVYEQSETKRTYEAQIRALFEAVGEAAR